MTEEKMDMELGDMVRYVIFDEVTFAVIKQVGSRKVTYRGCCVVEVVSDMAIAQGRSCGPYVRAVL